MQPIPETVTDVTVYPYIKNTTIITPPVFVDGAGIYSVDTLATQIFYNLSLSSGRSQHGGVHAGGVYVATFKTSQGRLVRTPRLVCHIGGEAPQFGHGTKNVDIMVAVNVGRAIAGIAGGNSNIGEYVYMVDTTGSSGSGQGSDELVTTVTSGDTLIWQVVSINPAETVTIDSFFGAAIGPSSTPGAIINPVEYPQEQGAVWGGAVYATSNGRVQYSMNLMLNGMQGWFDPYIISNPPT